VAQLGFFGFGAGFTFFAVFDACLAVLECFTFFWDLALVVVAVWALAVVAAMAGAAIMPRAAKEAIRLRFTVILLRGMSARRIERCFLYAGAFGGPLTAGLKLVHCLAGEGR
jgi:hypothetical protein